ncbi:hypothetical protein VR44_40560, partial [Streptomyces katrae]
PEQEPATTTGRALADGTLVPWMLSGRSAGALRAQAERLLAYVEERPGLAVADVAYSLMRRSEMEHRAVVVGRDREEFLAGLRTLARDGATTPAPAAVSGLGGGPAVLFTGQGSQRPGMG